MSPATVQYRSLYKKLFFRHGEIIYFLPELIGPYGMRIVDLLAEIDDQAKPIGSDPVYTKLYRRIKYLAAKHVYKLTLRERVDWEATNKKRMEEVTRGVQAIFAAAVAGDTPPIVSAGTSPTDENPAISIVKVREPGFHVVPTGQLFYLFSQVQNSNNAGKGAKDLQSGSYWDRLYKIPSRCGPDRIEAIHEMMSVQGRSWFVRDCTCPMCGKQGKQIPGQKIAACPACGTTWKPPIQERLRKKLRYFQSTFTEWEEKTLDKELFFDRGPGSDIVRLPCRTRFTDKGRKVKNIRTYDRGWVRANLLYSRGVFLTLTTDPSLHKSLWHANRHLARAWNRYLSLLLSRKKKAMKKGFDTEPEENDNIDNGTGRLRYIAAYEFQENGLIHLHVCFFGIRYLARMDQIADDWNRCGQGRIAHAYGIRRNGDTWEWNREKPADAAGKSPVDYLRKYLEKALYVSEHFPLYWVMNKRFCTMSRIFQTKECEGCRSVWGSGIRVCPSCGAPLKAISKGYRFIGALEKEKPHNGYQPFPFTPPAEMMKRHDRIMSETGPGVPA